MRARLFRRPKVYSPVQYVFGNAVDYVLLYVCSGVDDREEVWNAITRTGWRRIETVGRLEERYCGRSTLAFCPPRVCPRVQDVVRSRSDKQQEITLSAGSHGRVEILDYPIKMVNAEVRGNVSQLAFE